jgi:prepilin-type N-terminal cleavage/methylation domain-containing protein/prepilin-type processing-associated H-X9-DG protein
VRTVGFQGRGAALKGFTLIELLVVIAIIMLLAALLLPSLRSARESGRRATCMSNLRQLSVLFHLYRDDFNDQPFRNTLAEWDAGCKGHDFPWALYTSKYLPGPVKAGSGGSCNWPAGPGYPLRSPASVFRCPSQQRNSWGDGRNPRTGNFVYNCTLSGYQTASTGVPELGKVNRVKRPPLVYVFADPNGNEVGNTFMSLYDRDPNTQQFPHNGSALFIMLDGHVERVNGLVEFNLRRNIDILRADW